MIILAAGLATHLGSSYANQAAEPLNQSAKQSESFRLGFALSSPRKYASRFLDQTRTLQIRITPARAEEFQDTQFYDGRFIHRVLVKEVDGEVFLNLQLKNRDLNWIVTNQESPWRIVIDIWQNGEMAQKSQPDWNWNGYLSHEPQNRNKGALATSSQKEPVAESETLLVPEKSNIDLPHSAKTEKDTKPGHQADHKNQPEENSAKHVLARFLTIENFDQIGTEPLTPLERAKNFFRVGNHIDALNEYRREATLRQQQFKANPEALWLAGESALQTARVEVAKDYFLTLVATEPESSFASYGRLRLTDIDFQDSLTNGASEGTAQAAGNSSQVSSFLKRYLELARSENASAAAQAIAALRVRDIENSDRKTNNQKQEELKNRNGTEVDLLANFQGCLKEDSLVQWVKNECAYQLLLSNLKTDDLVSAQGTIQNYETKWPKDSRIMQHKAELSERIKTFAESIKSSADLKNWIPFEKATAASWIAFTEQAPNLLKMRAAAWESEGNTEKALQFYQKTAEREADAKARMSLLAKCAHLAAKINKPNVLNSNLKKIQAMPERTQTGLAAEDYAYVKELALPPFNNSIALNLMLDEIFKGFHSETDIRTIVSLSEKIEGTREADILFEKLLAIPAKSSAEAELKEDSLMNYAETLRNQGRLVKSADMFLAVANLDNGKNRAEAAYKAGVVFFRAGLLEKATASWNMAASDLENSKYSALATERLNRIR